MTRTLVIGGARSGKSEFAEQLLADEAAVEYLATAGTDATDAEWTQRIAKHRERRPEHWITVETFDVAPVLRSPGPAVLLESVTAWLTTAMSGVGFFDSEPGADQRLRSHVERLLVSFAAAQRDVVAVTDEVGLSIVPESAVGRAFRDALGAINQTLATLADEVHLVVAGLPLRLK
jgi:adenosyl cobinamide kinase/adenosyl cobinamide phosphate guanylyltransferase